MTRFREEYYEKGKKRKPSGTVARAVRADEARQARHQALKRKQSRGQVYRGKATQATQIRLLDA